MMLNPIRCVIFLAMGVFSDPKDTQASEYVHVIINTLEANSLESIPARIHLSQADGQPVRSANNLPFWHDHVTSPGTAEFELLPGDYQLTVERGPEWSSVARTVEIP
jgi:hypothetical protein